MVDSTNLPEVDINQIATDLNGKMDRDCLNASDTGNVQMAKASMPSSRYINLTLGASGSTYTAPANGWFCLKNNAGGGNPLLLNNQTRHGISIMQSGGITGFAGNTIYLPCSKGDIVNANYTAPSGSTTNIYFIYAQGSESEAS